MAAPRSAARGMPTPRPTPKATAVGCDDDDGELCNGDVVEEGVDGATSPRLAVGALCVGKSVALDGTREEARVLKIPREPDVVVTAGSLVSSRLVTGA